GAGGLDVAPDGRSGAQVAQREPEAFDRQPSVVADGVERREHVAPRDVARSRRAAVVLARVHVTDVATARAERLSEMLLLDVRVERVEQQADARMADRLAQRDAIGDRVEEVRLEAVERFDRKRHAVLVERFAELLVALDGTLPLVSGPTPAGKVADRRVERTRELRRPEIRRHPDRV